MIQKEDEEFIVFEIGPWWWQWATDEEKERHRMMNPFFVPRLVKMPKPKGDGTEESK